MIAKNKKMEMDPLFPEPAPAWETKGVFSEHFIRSRLKGSSLWPSEEDVKPLYDYASQLWKKKYISLARGDEELTKREFLEHILNKLGFSFLPARKIPALEQRKVPDYLLYQDETEKDNALEYESIDQYKAAITILEAKKLNHPLDAVSKKETPGRFPHQ
jgi:hypothetical protein